MNEKQCRGGIVGREIFSSTIMSRRCTSGTIFDHLTAIRLRATIHLERVPSWAHSTKERLINRDRSGFDLRILARSQYFFAPVQYCNYPRSDRSCRDVALVFITRGRVKWNVKIILDYDGTKTLSFLFPILKPIFTISPCEKIQDQRKLLRVLNLQMIEQDLIYRKEDRIYYKLIKKKNILATSSK